MKQVARFVRSAMPTALRRKISTYLAIGPEPEDNDFPSIEPDRRTLANLGFAPRFCVDIGAYNGDWTRLCRSVFPTTSVFFK